MILGDGNIGKLATENSRANMREKINNYPMRRLYLQRHKDNARETEVSWNIGKWILTQFKSLTINFKQKSVWYDVIGFSDGGIYQEK